MQQLRYRSIREALPTILTVMVCWSFEAYAFMLFPMLATPIMKTFSISPVQFGTLVSAGLLGTMVGGIVSGSLADMVGRLRVLLLSLLIYGAGALTIAGSACYPMLGLGMFVVGFGLGAEWSTGMTLISETVKPSIRGRAVGLAQAGWPLGVLSAIATVVFVYPVLGWRWCFVVASLPVLLVVVIGSRVPESELWKMQSSKPKVGITVFEILKGRLARRTLLALTMNVFAMFSYWMFWTWLPTYLYRVRGLSVVKSAEWLVSAQVGAFFGYVSYGFLQDYLGRRKAWTLFTATEAIMILTYVSLPLTPEQSIAVGLFLGYFTGYWSGFGALLSEIFPTEVRSTALGFIFNVGRAINFVSPIAIAWLSQVYGWVAALSIAAVAAFIASALVWAFPETKGRELASVS